MLRNWEAENGGKPRDHKDGRSHPVAMLLGAKKRNFKCRTAIGLYKADGQTVGAGSTGAVSLPSNVQNSRNSNNILDGENGCKISTEK